MHTLAQSLINKKNIHQPDPYMLDKIKLSRQIRTKLVSSDWKVKVQTRKSKECSLTSSGVVVLLAAGLAGMREVARRQEQPQSVEYSWQGIAGHWDTADCTHSAECWAPHTWHKQTVLIYFYKSYYNHLLSPSVIMTENSTSLYINQAGNSHVVRYRQTTTHSTHAIHTLSCTSSWWKEIGSWTTIQELRYSATGYFFYCEQKNARHTFLT